MQEQACVPAKKQEEDNFDTTSGGDMIDKTPSEARKIILSLAGNICFLVVQAQVATSLHDSDSQSSKPQ